jgi:two-component system heavy metal sensor histidine kinase CusS
MSSATSRTSLTARLTIGFVTILVIGYVGIGIYLDYAFQEEFTTEDARELAAHVTFVQQILAEHQSFESLRADLRRLLDAKAPHPRLEFVIKDPVGSTIESSYVARSLADRILKSSLAPLSDVEPTSTLGYEGRVWRTLVTSSTLGDATHTSITLIVALDVTDREHFVRRYRSSLVSAVLVAVVVAGLLGLPLVRGALSQLNAMARRATEISMNRLNERLPVDVPSELRILSLAFNGMLERLEESFRRLSQFSADVAHELRAPITNLMGEAEVALRRARSASDYQAVLESAIEECRRASRLIDAMLFLARADNAQIALRRDLLDGRREVERVAEDYEELLTERGVDLRIEGSAEIWADGELLRRAVSNLLENAITHTPGGQVIGISLGMGQSSTALMEISNPGPGIPADALPRVFERFFRVGGGKAGHGAGLGLAIVRTVLELHGGSASVRSAPEGPTVFTLCFPGRVVHAVSDASGNSLSRPEGLGALPVGADAPLAVRGSEGQPPPAARAASVSQPS